VHLLVNIAVMCEMHGEIKVKIQSENAPLSFIITGGSECGADGGVWNLSRLVKDLAALL
jgi:hypothetical protein